MNLEQLPSAHEIELYPALAMMATLDVTVDMTIRAILGLHPELRRCELRRTGVNLSLCANEVMTLGLQLQSELTRYRVAAALERLTPRQRTDNLENSDDRDSKF